MILMFIYMQSFRRSEKTSYYILLEGLEPTKLLYKENKKKSVFVQYFCAAHHF